MNDIFTSLVHRALGIAEIVVPRLPGLYESAEAWPEPEWLDEVEEIPAEPVRAVEEESAGEVPELTEEEPPRERPGMDLRFSDAEPAKASRTTDDPTPPVQLPPPELLEEPERERPAGSRRPKLAVLVKEVVENARASSIPVGDVEPKGQAEFPVEISRPSPVPLPPSHRQLRPAHLNAPTELPPTPSRPEPVQVRIGRIEVKAAPAPAPPAIPSPRPAPRVAVSLQDYLSRRRRS